MIYFILFFVPFLVILIIFCIYAASKESKINDRNFDINQQINIKIKESNFIKEKVYFMSGNTSVNKEKNYKMQIAFDTTNKKMLLVDYNEGKIIIADFSDLLNYEIYENNSNITSGGAIGGIFTALYSAETSGQCKDLRLNIVLNSYETPNVVYEIIGNTIFNSGISKSTKIYSQMVSELKNVVSFLDVIINNNKKNEQ